MHIQTGQPELNGHSKEGKELLQFVIDAFLYYDLFLQDTYDNYPYLSSDLSGFQ